MSTRNRSKMPKATYGLAATRNIMNSSKDFIVDRYTGKKATRNIASDMKLVMSMLNTEDKHYSFNATAITVQDSASSVAVLGSPSQGTDGQSRTGDSIKLNKFDFSIMFIWGNGTTTAQYNQTFEWYFVKYNKTTSNTAFSIADMLDADVNGNFTPMCLPNTDKNQNFTILASGSQSMQLPQGTNATGNIKVQSIVHGSVDLDFHQLFNGATGSSITDNYIAFVCVGLVPVNVAGSSSYTLSYRQWFVDN